MRYAVKLPNGRKERKEFAANGNALMKLLAIAASKGAAAAMEVTGTGMVVVIGVVIGIVIGIVVGEIAVVEAGSISRKSGIKTIIANPRRKL